METDAPEEYVPVAVTLPSSLATEMDAYATTHGFVSLDAVVQEALARQ